MSHPSRTIPSLLEDGTSLVIPLLESNGCYRDLRKRMLQNKRQKRYRERKKQKFSALYEKRDKLTAANASLRDEIARLSIASEHQRIESHILRQQRCDNAVEILSYCFPGADFEPENPRVLPSTQSLVKNIFRRHLDKLPEEPMEEKLKQLVTPDVQVYIRGELHDPLEFFQRQEKTFHIRHVPSVRSMDPLNQRLCFSLDVGFGLQQPATAHVFVHFNDWDYRVSKIIVPSLRNLSTLREIRV